MDIAAYQNMRISTRGKRPLRNLTPGDKVRAIQRIHNGETKASVSRDIGVPESTLRGWCKNEQKLRFMCRQLGAAINEPGLPITANLDNPPEKRAKLIESFDYGHAYGLNRLGVMSSAAGCASAGASAGGRHNNNNSNQTKTENKTNNFINNNIINDFMKKNGFGFETIKQQQQPSSDNGFLQSLNSGLPTTTNFPQLPFLPNAHLLSFLNPSLTASATTQQLTNNNAGNKTDVTKIPLRSSNVGTELKEKNNKKQLSSLMVKNWANDALLIPSVNTLKNHSNINGINLNFHDKNDTNNNDVRPTTMMHQTDFNDFPTLFPTLGGLPLPTPTPTPTPNVDAEIRNNAILQWTKVFNASLNFLALAAAAAAVQPNLNHDHDRNSSANSESSESVYRHNDDYEIATTTTTTTMTTRPLASIEHSEDSNFESEPEDLSIRSGTSKISSPPQTPIQDLMSDSSTLSDNEH